MKPGAVGCAGLETHFLELIGEVTDGSVFADAAGPAAFEVVCGEDLDMAKQVVGGDGGQRRLEIGCVEDGGRVKKEDGEQVGGPRDCRIAPRHGRRLVGDGAGCERLDG